jgi:hypothetical protein
MYRAGLSLALQSHSSVTWKLESAKFSCCPELHCAVAREARMASWSGFQKWREMGQDVFERSPRVIRHRFGVLVLSV